MSIINKTTKFCNSICPSYSEAGDLAPITTLAMYAVSMEPIASIAVSTMLFANIYNTMHLVLQGAPIAPIPSIKPEVHISKEVSLKGEHLEYDFSVELEDEDKPEKDQGNIFRF